MLLSDFKEKEFIKTVLSNYATTASKDAFDDCIIIDLEELMGIKEAPNLVYSIDHPSFIKRKGMSEEEQYRYYGKWASACTLGDVLAMGATPKGFSLALSAPVNTPVKCIELIMEGIHDTLQRYNTEFQGGNLDNSSLETVCMAWGVVDKDKIIKRRGANPGDYIVATADLGLGWACYLVEKLELEHRFDERTVKFIKEFKEIPHANIEPMLEIFKIGGAITSGMDLTDGLIEFLYSISENNNLGVQIDYGEIKEIDILKKISTELDFDPRLMCFSPGYDTPISHGWTIDSKYIDIVKNIFSKHNAPFNIYGRVVEDEGVTLMKNGKRFDIPLFYDDQFSDDLFNDWKALMKNLSQC